MNLFSAYWGGATFTAKLVLIAAILLGVFALGAALGGWGGYAWQADEVEDAQKAQAKAVHQLGLMESSRDSWKRLADDREGAVIAQNRAHAQALERAKLEQVAAKAATARANKAADEFLEAKQRLDRIAVVDSSQCPVHPICGSPLQ